MYDEIKIQLEKLKKQLLNEIKDSASFERDDLKSEVGDSYDHATSERERELNLLMMNREREKIKDIDEALSRIDEGTYGVCAECDEEIPLPRLEALPFTELCVACKSELEELDRLNNKIKNTGNPGRIKSLPGEDEDS